MKTISRDQMTPAEWNNRHDKETNTVKSDMNPDDLVIVGLDTKDGPDHPRYDERVKLPINQERVANVMEYGILETVVLHGGSNDVMMGRQRVRWAREANKRFALFTAKQKAEWVKEHGTDHVNYDNGTLRVAVPVQWKKLDEVTAYGAMISENEVRRKDNTMVAARKMETFISVTVGDLLTKNPEMDVDAAHKQALKKAAIAFGCSEAKVKQYQKLLDLDPSVQEKVENGELAAYEVLGLGDLAPEEQARVAEKKAKAKKEGKQVHEEGDSSRKLRVSKQEIRKVAAQLGGDAQIALLWSIGEIDEAAARETKGFAKALDAARAKK